MKLPRLLTTAPTLLVALPTLAGCGAASPAPPPPAPAVAAVPLPAGCPAPSAGMDDAASPISVVRYLADDRLEGRLAGSEGERCAGAFVAERMRRLGLEPAGEDGTFFLSAPLASAVNPHAPGGTGRNVVGLLRGADPALAEEAVVVGAHYDHLGLGGAFSLSPDETAVHNGADDNASGVAAMLEAARLLAAGPRPARSVLFVAFTGEEQGLLGSAAYAEAPPVPLERTVAMLNLDMVGRLEDDPLIVYGVDTAEEWRDLVARHADAAGVETEPVGDGYGASDHTSFYARGVPVLHLFTNVHADYHRPTDDWEKVDTAGLRTVARLTAEIAGDVAGRRERLTLVEDAGSPRRAANSTATEERGYGAYLGSIPDFSPTKNGGVRLTGVRAGSPAEEAGIRGGDVIVGFGEMEIGDLWDLTEALRAHRPGQTVPIRILRDGEALTVEATLGRREEG